MANPLGYLPSRVNDHHVADHQDGGLVARQTSDADGSYEPARRLRRGWQLWVGDGWAEVGARPSAAATS
jgi:hypothetical protein